MTPTLTPSLTRGRIEALVMRVQGDFLDAPGLHLTLPQARRRFGLDDGTCGAVLDALVESTVLAKTPGGAYVRLMPRRPRVGPFTQRAA